MGLKIIKIPRYFSLKEQHVKAFVRVLDKLYHTKQNEVRIDFAAVEESSKGDMMVLFAQLEKIKETKNTNFSFSNTRVAEKKIDGDIYSLKKRLSKGEGANPRLNPSFVSVIANNLRKIGINKNREDHVPYCERVEALLTEILGNAIEHGIRKRKINFWFTIEVNRQKEEVVFVFADMGEGIARSHREAGLPLSYKFSGDSRIVINSLNGKLPSSTKEPNRGKGLPEVKKIIKDELVSNFELITNKVAINYSDKQFKRKKIPNFVGTYYSWTVTKDNLERWKNTP